MPVTTVGNTTTVTYDDQIDMVPVTTSGEYEIVAYGAPGGATPAFTTSGGLGAEIEGVVSLTAGTPLSVVAGGAGGQSTTVGVPGGGGGGSFVYQGSTLLLAAGGGGGGGLASNGGAGQASASGQAGIGAGGGGSGGLGGAGGTSSPADGGGGAGWGGNGKNGSGSSSGFGGEGPPSFAGGAGVLVNNNPVAFTSAGGFGGGGGAGGLGGGGGGGYSGGGGGGGVGGVGGGGGGGSFLVPGATDQVLVGNDNAGNGLVTITELVASTISVSGSGQTTTTGTAAVTPFTGVTITDPNPANPANPTGPTDTVTVTPNSTTSGTLSDSLGGAVNSSTDVYTVSGTASQVNTDLAALTFTPASGQTGTTSFTIADINWANLPSNPSGTTSVTVNSPLVASIITVPASDQPQTSTGLATVTPFKGVSISDTNPGSPTETVTVTPSSTTSGTLSDPNAATDHSTSSGGAITLTGPTSTVTTDLDALTFTPAFGQFGITTFTIADTNSANLPSTSATASVTVTPPPPPTAAQLKLVGADLIQFYKDDLAHKPTTADASKLASDFTTLDLSQAELGQLLGQTLTSATLTSSAATALGADIAATYYPKITTDLAHGGQGLPGDLTAMIGTTAAAGADDLLRTHFGQSQSQALAGTVQDFKLA